MRRTAIRLGPLALQLVGRIPPSVRRSPSQEAPMELALHFMNFTLPGGSKALGPTLAATAQAAEEAGCSTFTMMDHWFQMEGFATSEAPMLEGYTSLGFVAGKTEGTTLSLMVAGVTSRYPGLLAKTVTTLDVVSGGRAMLGIG